jgi:hypothetical protein
VCNFERLRTSSSGGLAGELSVSDLSTDTQFPRAAKDASCERVKL